MARLDSLVVVSTRDLISIQSRIGGVQEALSRPQGKSRISMFGLRWATGSIGWTRLTKLRTASLAGDRPHPGQVS
jgi:hypothetical protein